MLDNNDFHLLVRTPRNAMFSQGIHLESAFKKKGKTPIQYTNTYIWNLERL